MSIHLWCRYHRVSGQVLFYLTLHLWARSEHVLLKTIQGGVMPEPSTASATICKRVSEEGRLASGQSDRHRRRHSKASLQCPEQCLRAASLASRTAQVSYRDVCHICQPGVDYLGSTWEHHVEEVLFNRANQVPWLKEWGLLTKNFFFFSSCEILSVRTIWCENRCCLCSGGKCPDWEGNSLLRLQVLQESSEAHQSSLTLLPEAAALVCTNFPKVRSALRRCRDISAVYLIQWGQNVSRHSQVGKTCQIRPNCIFIIMLFLRTMVTGCNCK